MEFIEGVLAFSVIMIVLSTIVSGVVEVIMRAFTARGFLLRRAIDLLLTEHLLPRIAAAADAASSGKAFQYTTSPEVLEALTSNPSVGSGWFGARPTTVENLSAWAFLQRLANTEHGREILDLGDEAAEAFLADAVRTFERYTAAGHETLRRSANTIALLVGLALAPALNIHAPDLLDHLVKDAPARNALIAQGEAAAEAYQLQSRELQRSIDALASSDPVIQEEALAALSDAATRLERTMNSVSDLKALGLPILHPYDTEAHGERSMGWWLFGVVLGGFLIGLGGPFWYRVFQSLSSLTRLLKGLGGASAELASDPAAEKKAIVGEAPGTLDPAKLLADFKTAAGPDPERAIVRIYE